MGHGSSSHCVRACATIVVIVVALGPVHAASAGRGADGEYEQRSSSHFTLYQDVDIDRTSGFYGSRRFERQVLEVLENALRNLEGAIGLRPRDKIIVTVHDPGLFDERFQGIFRFPAAGFYGGTIHVRGDTAVSDRLVRVLHHELVHAAFDQALPGTPLPAWFNEGVAEWFEARSMGQHKLADWQQRALSNTARSGGLFTLDELSTAALGHLGPRAAQLAYLQSYGFIDYLVRERGELRLRDLCRRVSRTGDLADTLRRIYRGELPRLEAGFLEALGGGAH